VNSCILRNGASSGILRLGKSLVLKADAALFPVYSVYSQHYWSGPLIILKTPHHVRAAFGLFALAGSLTAQALTPQSTPAPVLPVCGVYELAHSNVLSLRQRACYYGQRLISPSTILRTAFASGISEWRNSPYESRELRDDYAYRFATQYASRAAKSSSELLAGYFNHEDPRPRPSHENGVWDRTRAALLSVVAIKDEEGNSRPALSPIAGAFGSGFVETACYRTNHTAEDGLWRTGISYTSYFMTALYREFRPDIRAFASRLRHKKNDAAP
jgi:hypothetical protein